MIKSKESTNILTSTSHEAEIARALYSILRTGAKISRADIKSQLNIKNEKDLTNAATILKETLRSAGYDLIESKSNTDKRKIFFQLTDVSPIDYILFTGRIGSKMYAADNFRTKNIELIPELYQKILEKKVIRFQYSPFGRPAKKVTFNPHILKEYNGRWFLFGFTEDRKQVSNYSIDRIASDITDVTEAEYIEAEEGCYRNYFNERIGVSDIKGKPQDIILHTNSHKGHGLLVTKQIHTSQEEIEPYSDELKYGVVKLHVGINIELVNYLLSLRENVTVIEPQALIDEIKERLNKMMILYQ